MYIFDVVLVPWLNTQPVLAVYFLHLVRLTVENIVWSEGLGNVVELPITVLLIGGTAWLWSNKEVGLIYLLSCSTSYFMWDLGTGQDNSVHHYHRCHWIVCLLESIVGIVWWWSHMRLLLDLAISAIFIYTLAVMFSWDGIGQNNTTGNDEDIADALKVFDRMWASIMKGFILAHLRVFIYIPSTSNFLVNMLRGLHSMLLGSTADISTHRTISRHHENIDGTSKLSASIPAVGSGVTTTRSSWQAIIGQNVNQGGIQTIGGVNISEIILHIQAQGACDTNFNTLVMRVENRKYFYRLTLLACLASVSATYYFSVIVKTVTESCSQSSYSEIQ